MSVSLLIVDDDHQIREFLRSRLGTEFEVTCVANGQEAWEYLDGGGDPLPDVVLLDVMMPRMDGYRLLDRLRSDSRFDDVEVVMLTSRGREDDAVRALETGAADYVRKPFSPAELVTRIDRLVG